jgi:hypothetical protein
LVLTRERGQGNAGLFVTGRDIEHEVELALRFNDDDCRWESDGRSLAEIRISHSRQQIIEAIRVLGRPSTIREIRTQLIEDGRSVNYEALRKNVGRMVKDAQLSQDSKNRYEVSHVSHHP